MSESRRDFSSPAAAAPDLLITGARIVTPDGVLEDGYVRLEGGLMSAVGPMSSLPAPRTGEQMMEAEGSWLLPGFIDVHVHGGYGSDFMDASAGALDAITRFHASEGTTAMLATTVTASREAIEEVLASVQAYRSRPMPYAQLAGVHLEGPFISPRWPGAQNPAYITAPQPDWIREWLRSYPELIRIVTLAPETEGAYPLIDELTRQGIVAACGHTDAAYEEILEARRCGLRHAVHTFNAMTGLHHRQPGTAGAVLTEDGISAEIIADGLHVHPACIRLLTRAKPAGSLLLVTDAISAAGLGDGSYELGGLGVTVQNGAARLTEGGALAGSTLTMMAAFRYMVQTIGLPVEEASRLASANPAALLGLASTHGCIAEGRAADLLLISPQLELEQVWIQGRAQQLA